MKHSMVRRLVAKDLYLHRWTIAFYLIAGGVSLAIVGYGTDVAFYLGSVLLVSALLAVGIHLVMATVVMERKENTLAFVMTLPISASQYTASKVLANLGAFTLAWGTLLVATLLLIQSRIFLPDGLIPYAVLVLVEIFVGYCILLGVALVTESEGWTILAIVLCNLGFNFFLYAVAKAPAIGDHMEGLVPVWNAAVGWVLAAEIATVVVVLAATFFLQAHKREFV